MKQFKDSFGIIIESSLNQYQASASFEKVWGVHVKNKKYLFGHKKVIMIPIMILIAFIAICTIGFASYNFTRIVDKTDYQFVDDVRVTGKWQTVDFVRTIDEFAPGQKFWKEGLFLKELAFIKEGKTLVAFNEGNGNLAYSPYTWTKGIVINKQQKTAAKYEIKEINGSEYMFFEWKNGDYVWRGTQPSYYVLKKIDSNDYSNFVTATKEDKIDYPFVNDPQMIGSWNTVDFVKEISNFEPGIKSSLDDLFLTSFDISQNGEITVSTSRGKDRNGQLTWTKGLILDKLQKTASKCEIKEIDGETYMFYEWKSGDYTLRGMQPWYYVFKKVK